MTEGLFMKNEVSQRIVKFNQTLSQIDLPHDMIHLGIGQPSSRLLPLKEMETAAAHSLSKGNSFFLSYGEARGNDNFRKTLAGFLTGQYPDPVAPEQLLITNGNSQGLDMICTLFTWPRDYDWDGFIPARAW